MKIVLPMFLFQIPFTYLAHEKSLHTSSSRYNFASTRFSRIPIAGSSSIAPVPMSVSRSEKDCTRPCTRIYRSICVAHDYKLNQKDYIDETSSYTRNK